MMEHRLEGRKEIHSSILVIIDRNEIVKASVKNISFGGMLTDMGERQLPDGAVVELACTAFRQCGWKVIRLKARIVHTKNSLSGMKFIENRKRGAALWSELEARAAEPARFREKDQDNAPDRGVSGNMVTRLKRPATRRPYRRSEHNSAG